MLEEKTQEPSGLDAIIESAFEADEPEEQISAEESDDFSEEEVLEESNEQAEEGISDAGEEGEPEEQLIEAPEHWPQADKELFENLDQSGREFLLRRHKEMEGDYTRKTQEFAQQRKEIEPIKQFFDTWEPYANKMGMPLQVGLQKLLEADSALRNGTIEQKRQMLAQIASDYGVSFEDEEDYADPAIKALKDELSQVKNQLSGYEHGQKKQTEESYKAEALALFNEKDESGNFKYPHVEKLQPQMTTLLQSGQAQGTSFREQLINAYEMAQWMNPETRQQLLASQQASKDEKEKERLRKAAAQAKKSAKANRKGDGTETKPGKRTLDQIISENIEKLN